MTKSVFYKIFIFLSAVLPFLISTTKSSAEVTAWQDLGGGRTRLITVYDPVEGKIEGIVDVELQPGWVTYWRNPGEAGIPPIFDFSKSSGVTVDQPLFPVPAAKYAAGITSIVYTNHVAFPFKAVPVISPLSGALQLDMVIGVCKEICIPAMASFLQDLSKLNYSDLASNEMIQQAYLKIPATKTDDPEWPSILNAKWKTNSVVSIEVRIPKSALKLELFAEGNDNWFFFPAKISERDGYNAIFDLDMAELPKNADLSKTPLRLTLSADGIGSERSIIVGNFN